VVLNLIMIPFTQAKYGNGAIGAAVATGLTELGIMGGMIYLLPKDMLSGFRYEVALKSLLGSGAMVLASIGIRGIGIPWTINVMVSSTVYIGTIIFLGVLEPVEKTFLRNLIIEKVIARIRSLFLR
jgi:hypothetical protein